MLEAYAHVTPSVVEIRDVETFFRSGRILCLYAASVSHLNRERQVLIARPRLETGRSPS